MERMPSPPGSWPTARKRPVDRGLCAGSAGFPAPAFGGLDDRGDKLPPQRRHYYCGGRGGHQSAATAYCQDIWKAYARADRWQFDGRDNRDPDRRNPARRVRRRTGYRCRIVASRSTSSLPPNLCSSHSVALSEVTGPREYVQKAGKASVLPALWYVARDGHVNVTHAEHEAAIRALIRYIETGRIKHSKDATIHPAVRESSAKFKDGGAYGKVTKIHPSYGNLNPEFIEADLKTLRLAPNSHFQVKFREKSFKVFLGTTYSDVPRGEWVAFLTAEGNLKIARNFANAAKALGCQSGDMIFIGPLTIRKESISKK